MSINVVWDDEAHTIVRAIYDGFWTWEQYQMAAVQVGMMLSSAPHRVDGIIDICRSPYVPYGYMEQLRSIRQGPPMPQLGIIVFTGEHVAYEMFHTFVQTEGAVFFSYAYAQSIEIARHIIEAARAGQAWQSDAPPLSPGEN